ncbi:MAG: hypothetical protein H7831_03205 [Magnetococcus sp. WYHC-3]
MKGEIKITETLCQIASAMGHADWASWVTAGIVLFIGLKAAEIARYHAGQADREIVKSIYSMYSDAIRAFMPSASFAMPVYLEVLQKLHEGIDTAALYGLTDIEEFLKSVKDDFVKGAESYTKCYNDEGQAEATHNGNDVKIYSDIKGKLITDYLENKNMDVFRKYLHIKIK